MLVRLHTITLPIHHLHSDFFLGAVIPIPWQRKGWFPCWMPPALNLPIKTPSYLQEWKCVSISWRKAAERPILIFRMSHIPHKWAVISSTAHSHCLSLQSTKEQLGLRNHHLLTASSVPPTYGEQGRTTKGQQSPGNKPGAVEQGDSGHLLCSLTSNINNPLTGWWYLWSLRRRARRMTPPGRKVQSFKE